ncbi:DNA sulfur modification protein DndD [Nocardioides sp. C4-1]|uniref:DNA sulfur modification protein DndD n=1 Tax=Nocardioides sp. C4-1 TaxID=3151851 RepID=UPI003263749F
MIIDELVLDNVGTFGGRHVIELTPPSDQQPIILIGGLNGAGKTTILESIHLVLFGSLAQSSQRRAGGYDGYLRRLIHHSANPAEGARIELRFHAFHDAERKDYRVCRKWRTTGKGLSESLVVFVNDRLDQALCSTWTDFVETILPRGVAGLFFFDGEQIEALADMKRSQEVLDSALSALLGLELVDRLQADLKVLKRRHQPEAVPESVRGVVENKKAVVAALRAEEQLVREEDAAARVAHERASKHAFETAEQWRAAGGDLAQSRAATERERASLQERLKQVEADMRTEMAGAAPMLLVEELLAPMYEQARREELAARSQTVLTELLGRDQQLMDLLDASEVGGEVRSQIEEFLHTDRSARAQESQMERLVGLSDLTKLVSLRNEVLPTASVRLRSLNERRSMLADDLGAADRVLVAMPDEEAIAEIQSSYLAAVAAEHQAQAVANAAGDRLASLRSERERADLAYERALDAAAEAGLAADDDRRMIDHLERVAVTLDSLKVAASERHVGRIGALVFEALSVLLRKSDLVASVAIDPVTRQVQLIAPDGREIEAADLSAGERQLLAVSLLWGLARAAGRPLPMVVDTPLGRLDGAHREHLLDRYFPHASHQVVLLSTDTEIDQNALKRIRSSVGRAYTLSYDVVSKSTIVDDGYFWEAV